MNITIYLIFIAGEAGFEPAASY